MPFKDIKRTMKFRLAGISSKAIAARRRGDAAREARRWEEAARAYREYLDEQPRHAALWVQFGHMLKESGRLPEARDAYETAVGIEPGDADAMFYYGHLLALQGDFGAAAQAYQASFRLNGNADARREMDRREIAPHLDDKPVEIAGAPMPFRRGRDVGTIDNVNGCEIDGWAVDPENASRPAEIVFCTRDRVIGGCVSNRFRADVALLGLGTTTAGFAATLDLDRNDRRIVRVHAYLKSTGEELNNSPFETTGFSPLVSLEEGEPVTMARFAMAKRFDDQADGEVAIFVTHSPDGVIKPHVMPYVAALRDNGIRVLLVVIADRPVRLSQAQLDMVAGAMVRENIGYDFAAWAHALRIHPEVYKSSILYFINDSMFGPNDADAFRTMLDRLRKSDADFVGLTESHESGWHIQSFFMAMKRSLLSSFAVQNFFGNMVNLPGKQAVIDHFETKLASIVEANGFKTESLFSSHHPMNATMFAWRELIDSGFPFVKTLLFRQKSHLFDIDDWEDDLEARGFDVDLLKDMLRHQGVTGEVAPDFPLLAMAADESLRIDAPLKVAFYGPWNYDNGLGSASRGMIAALRTTGVELNLCPVKKPFHIHRLQAPDYDIRDFEGPADIAIVHLNPDSWHLLTDDQRREIAAARKRIGYWVWEMAHIPEGWLAEFSSVDRIWAPSGYCATLFDAQNAAPVDVVPHAVPLPEATPTTMDRDALLTSLDIPAGRRIILYVFDGSSYLVRKNPHALVRAFAASGLGGKGWTLVLKTKHLMDRPEDGKAFRTLATGVPDVVLLDRALPHNELNALFAAADIYASPHCSEGFGLTIAEAMAAGKSVVATDFSGSTEFLDKTCGYPVRADPWRLTENFGHYVEGGEWARIDETALAKTLTVAAEAIARGDLSIGAAARDRIATRLSYQAVGERISASFAATLADATPRWPTPAPLDSKLLAGRSIDEVELGSNLTIAPLQAGSLMPEASDELKRVPAKFDRWVMFVPADARIDPDIRSILMPYAASRPDVSIFYADDVAVEEETLAGQLRLKPDFDVTLFVAQDYIGAPLIVRGSALHALGGLRHDLGEAALTDLILRAWARGMSIARVPYVLAGHPGKRPSAPVDARRKVLEDHPALTNYDIRPGLTDGTLQLARRFTDKTQPPVTLLVPTRRSLMADGTSYVSRLLDSLADTDWPMDRLHVLVADDVTGTPDWATKRRPFSVKRIETPRAPDVPFNYAAKMNLLWRAAETDHLVMLNDDVHANDPAWLKALMTFAMSEDVGAVGPLLMYENGTVQHAGIVGGLFGVCAHAWLYRRSTAGTYQDWALTHREWSMITGAVVATRRAIMEQINGFDERFALEFNDIDLCLRMRAAGARIVYTPHARMTHAEKASRGSMPPPPEDIALFLRRWKGWLANDPAFHPRMDHHRFDLTPGYNATDWFVR
ncbi:MAG: glycosyltransferase [Pararhizobium sp.]